MNLIKSSQAGQSPVTSKLNLRYIMQNMEINVADSLWSPKY